MTTFYDFIRSFLGVNHRHGENPYGDPRFRNPLWNDNDDDDDDEDDESNDDHFRSFPGSGFNIFSSDPFEIHKFFEQQMEEMMKNFQSVWFNTNSDAIDVWSSSVPWVPDNGSSPSSPRDRYLKPSADYKEDTDVTGKVSGTEVLDMFDRHASSSPRTAGNSPVFSKSSSFKTISTKTIRRPNGGVEEERKVVINGEEKVTRTRILGDLKHSVTMTKKPDGTTYNQEEFINFDEVELPDFEEKWNNLTGRKKIPEYPSNRQDSITQYNRFDIGKIFESFFK